VLHRAMLCALDAAELQVLPDVRHRMASRDLTGRWAAECTSQLSREAPCVQVHASGLLPLMGTMLGSQTGGARRRGGEAALGPDDLNMICQIVTFYVTAAPGAHRRSLLATTVN